MRKDIYERMQTLYKEGVKPNYAEVARRYNCDYRTVKRYYEGADVDISTKPIKPSKLDEFKEIIKEKLEIPCSFTAIYEFVKKKGYKGKYTILRDYCSQYKTDQIYKATIRFETTPGLQAQVDWKESFRITSRNGELFDINIFLMVLGYSRLKYIGLTLDRNQDTLKQELISALKSFGGVPKEILFDNMKSVIDQSKTQYNDAVINSNFYQFSKDIGFQVIACRPYRPQTKGKVETLAKIMERLRVYNYEFDTLDELDEIVRELNYDINNSISQATNEVPIERFKNEKEYLIPLPNHEILNSFITKPVTRKVTKESMIVYNRSKYSLPIKYIGKTVSITINNDILQIYYNSTLIKSHRVSKNYLNYHKEDMIEILKSDALKGYKDDDIERFINQNMNIYDKIGG